MNEKMNVLDVQLDNCTAKDAMNIIAEYMQTEELNTVDIVTVDTLMRATQLDGMKEELEKLEKLEKEREGRMHGVMEPIQRETGDLQDEDVIVGLLGITHL